MRFRCPRCKELVTFLGKEGEKRIAACPACGYEAKLTFTAPQVSTGEYAIEVSHLVKQYKDLLAVNDISFNVKKGEIFAFLGPNGAGKTTTVEIIESIRKPTAGSIRILGKDIKTQFKDVKEFIGILPQEFHSFERLTVRETLLYFSRA